MTIPSGVHTLQSFPLTDSNSPSPRQAAFTFKSFLLAVATLVLLPIHPKIPRRPPDSTRPQGFAPSASPLCPSDVSATHAPVTSLGFSLPKTFVPIRRQTASSSPKPISPTPTLGPTRGHCATSTAETASATHPLFSPFVQARPSLQVEKRLLSCLPMTSRR